MSMSKKNVNRWYKLENAAKIFPPTSNKKDTKVFRFYVELFEEINPIFLQNALDETLEEFPLFKSTLKKGLFWYYLETTNIECKVEEEKNSPCDFITNDLLFIVSYFRKRINVEINHALTDGTGTLPFLKLLIPNYLIIKQKIQNKIVFDN